MIPGQERLQEKNDGVEFIPGGGRRHTAGMSLLPPSAPEEPAWTKVITPEGPRFKLPFHELWRYRDLILTFVSRDFTATYKQTVLGPLWYLLQPLFTTAMYALIFGWVAKLPSDGLPQFVFFLSGVVMWNYFADCLVKTSQTFTANAHIFGKVYFPRLTVPVGIVITNLITFGVQFGVFCVITLIFWWQGAPIEPSFRVVVLPVLLAQMAILGLGVGMIVAAVTTRYRDLSLLVGFGTQLWMYASGVVLPLSAVPEQYRWIFVLNPMVPIIEGFRFAFLGRGVVELWQLAISAGVTLAIFITGLFLFTKVEKDFMDTV